MNKERPAAAYPRDTPGSALLSILVRNYQDGTQLVLGSGNSDEIRSHGARYDLLIAIEAPEQLPVSDSTLLLYLDPSCAPARPQQRNAWQVRSAHKMDTVGFATWAHEVAKLLSRLVLEQGLVCVDLVDLALVFSLGAEPYNCLLCDWQAPYCLPDALVGKTFKHGLWVIFADSEQLDTALFEKTGVLLDQVMSADGMHLAAARVQTTNTARLLFIAS